MQILKQKIGQTCSKLYLKADTHRIDRGNWLTRVTLINRKHVEYINKKVNFIMLATPIKRFVQFHYKKIQSKTSNSFFFWNAIFQIGCRIHFYNLHKNTFQFAFSCLKMYFPWKPVWFNWYFRIQFFSKRLNIDFFVRKIVFPTAILFTINIFDFL